MRFKPPPPKSTIGWRVEFRPCEVQLTDFENAAIVCFVVLLTRVILSYQLNFIIPISKVRFWFVISSRFIIVGILYYSHHLQVDENMSKAQKRSAALTEKFWFRKNIAASTSKTANLNVDSSNDDASYIEMSINEIINGKVK